MDLGRAGEACGFLTEAVAVLEDAAYAKVDLGAASLVAERPAEAADALEEALTELGDGEEADRARFLLARAYRQLDQRDQALTLLAQVAAQCAAEGNPAGVGQMLAMSADILDELNRDEQYTHAADAYRAAEMPLHELTNRREPAASWQWANETERCLAALSTADDVAARVAGDERPVAREKAMLTYDGARILAAVGRPTEAVPRAASAAAAFRVARRHNGSRDRDRAARPATRRRKATPLKRTNY